MFKFLILSGLFIFSLGICFSAEENLSTLPVEVQSNVSSNFEEITPKDSSNILDYVIFTIINLFIFGFIGVIIYYRKYIIGGFGDSEEILFEKNYLVVKEYVDKYRSNYNREQFELVLHQAGHSNEVVRKVLDETYSK